MEQNQKTALLVMDMQSSILGMATETDATPFIAQVAKAIAKARAQKIPVIYVVVAFRPGTPEVSPNNKGFSALQARGSWSVEFAEQWAAIHPDVAPQKDEVVVTKRRVSAFTGSDLEVILRGQGIQHIVLTGIATSGVVLSTLREAADKDYQITVLANCCLDRDEEVHQVLTTKVFPHQANVLNLEQWS